MSDEKAIEALLGRGVAVVFIAYLWYRASKMELEFPKSWYPYAALVLAVFFPSGAIIAFVSAVLNAAESKIKNCGA